MPDIDQGRGKPTANAISLSSITATVRSKGVACPKCLTPVRDQVTKKLRQINHFLILMS